MEDVFHAVGNFPERIDIFMSVVIPGAMLTTVRFSIVANTPSGPLDFVVHVSNAKSISRISSSVHRSSSGQKLWSG